MGNAGFILSSVVVVPAVALVLAIEVVVVVIVVVVVAGVLLAEAIVTIRLQRAHRSYSWFMQVLVWLKRTNECRSLAFCANTSRETDNRHRWWGLPVLAPRRTKHGHVCTRCQAKAAKLGFRAYRAYRRFGA